jgi:hypothetical protein
MTTAELPTMMDDVLAEEQAPTPQQWTDFHSTDSMHDTALYSAYFTL